MLNQHLFLLCHISIMEVNFFEATSDKRYSELCGNGENLVNLVLDTLGYLSQIGLNVAFLLDFVLWGSKGCISNATIWNAQMHLTHYHNLQREL